MNLKNFYLKKINWDNNLIDRKNLEKEADPQ